MILRYDLPDGIQRFVFRDGEYTVLSSTKQNAASKIPFPPVPGDLGACGVKSSQNVLQYFEIGLPGDQIYPHFEVGQFPSALKHLPWVGKNQWVFPNNLRAGLENCMHEYGCPNFSVQLHHGKTEADVIESLKAGFPVITLVNGGFHYISVVGFDQHGFHVLDNACSDKRASIDMSFGFEASVYDALPDWLANGSFVPGTYLTFSSSAPIAQTPV